MKRITLKKGRDYSVRHQHPWIFSGAIARSDDGIQDGDPVLVLSEGGEKLAVGHYALGGSIAVKILGCGETQIDEDLIFARLSSALAYRTALGLPKAERTTGYRLVHGEGDRLPGLIIDIYDQTAVLQCHSTGMIRIRDKITEALRVLLGDKLSTVIDRTESTSTEEATLCGEETTPTIFEHGLCFRVDCLHGQKTGFFLDQRENREAVRNLAQGRNVLNAFCYSGGFSISALAGGAKSVVSLDASEKALELVNINLSENISRGILQPTTQHENVCEDFLRYMQSMSDSFDLIVLDPPAFAKHRKALESGLKGYRSINTAALKAIRPGGLLATFSCSQLVSAEDFLKTIEDAARRAERRVRITKQLHQAPCHPTNLFHPEGNYLKVFVLYVE